jgi:superfamily II DNA/RNA helicase
MASGLSVTPYHAKYFSNELQRLSVGGSIGKISQSIFNAQVDLNPHQVEAALFAFQSPISKGVILADEVGLGKTIEAGLILSQYWAERKRNIIIICPASLRKQWAGEIEEKFFLPFIIMESKSFNQLKREGYDNPFEVKNRIIITSYNFASLKKEEIRSVKWDISFVDEAHKLRNSYKANNKIGSNIKFALNDVKKVLLTATPLQNSLMELYGITSVIDDYIFGDQYSFRDQYNKVDGDLEGLRKRLKVFCKRTLRKDVLEYIPYTKRIPMTEEFIPTDDEHSFYTDVSAFLLRADSYSIPKKQRMLITLMLRKLLASSTFAISATLEKIRDRLIKLRDGLIEEGAAIDFDDEEFLESIEEDNEDLELEEEDNDEVDYTDPPEKTEAAIELSKIKEEIDEINGFIQRAATIKRETKSRALLLALEKGFEEMKKARALKKALIFTESRRTQDYLNSFLKECGYTGKIVLFNGSNSDPESKDVFDSWLKDVKNQTRITGSRTADKRAAIVDFFRNNAEIMIATEAAAEGINLQFCSLVINYDMPWNPQRIEQRIGRCHRYGQKNDVVVINFLNKRNEADQRIYALLKDKFHLFSEIFGASDDVLGSDFDGVGFERKILQIFQKCRTQEEINREFKLLQDDLEEKIKEKDNDTKRKIIDHFDEEVHAKLKMKLDETVQELDKTGRLFWSVTKSILDRKASFNDRECSFVLKDAIGNDVPAGKYKLISRNIKKEEILDSYIYRLSHPLGEFVLETAKTAQTPEMKLSFDVSSYPKKLSVVEVLKGNGGHLVLSKLTIKSYEEEEHLLFNAFDRSGNKIDQEVCEKLFQCSATVYETSISGETRTKLNSDSKVHARSAQNRSFENNNRYFKDECSRLDKWADDMMASAQKELADLRYKINAAKREERNTETTEEQLASQEKISKFEKERRKLQQKIFEVEDEISAKRDEMIEKLKKQMTQKTEHETLFIIEWEVR